ncbi:MAG: polysaccharide deacetylase family protein [Terracidiphilus sp.]|jgi:hypothetical protein
MESLGTSCHGRNKDFLVTHFCAGIAGRKISPRELFSGQEQDWIFGELSRRVEAETVYAPGERRTWRREHLSAEDLEGIRRPRVDEFVFKRLRERGLKLDEVAPRWPDGHRFALCITHDMDHVSRNNWQELWRRAVRQRTALPRPLGQGDWISSVDVLRGTATSLLRHYALPVPDRLAGIAEWMKIEDGSGFRSTFYFFAGGVGDWHPWDMNYRFSDKVPFSGRAVQLREIMRELTCSGWEIGLHPSYHAAASLEWLREQKRLCEEASGQQVVSVRQHYLQYHPRLTPALQSEAGLLTDSTQGFNDMIGFRAGSCFPYLCWDHMRNITLPLLEVPLHVQDGPLMKGAASVDNAIQATFDLIDTVESIGGCLVILWHPLWLATDEGLQVFRAVIKEAKHRNAWGCTVQQLASWWLTRTEGIIGEANCSFR